MIVVAIGIDPGTRVTGLAILLVSQTTITIGALRVVRSPLPPAPKGKKKDRRLRTVQRREATLLMIDRIENAVMEEGIDVFHYASEGHVKTVATVEAQEAWGGRDAHLGSMLGVSLVAGAAIVICRQWASEVHYATPYEWKGNRKKEEVVPEIHRLVPSLAARLVDVPASYHEHLIDAVGIALYPVLLDRVVAAQEAPF